jgi:hypothetical protein
MIFKFSISTKITFAAAAICGVMVLFLSWYVLFLVDKEFNLHQKSISALKIAETAMDVVSQNSHTDGKYWRYLYEPSQQNFQNYLEGFLSSKSKTENMFLMVQSSGDSVYEKGQAQLDKIRIDKDIEKIVLQLKSYYDDYDAKAKSGSIKESLIKNNELISEVKISEIIEDFSNGQKKYSKELTDRVNAIERNIKIYVIVLAAMYLFMLVLLVIGASKMINLVKNKLKK